MSGFEKLWKARRLVLGACCTATLGCLAGSAYAIPTQYEIVDLGADFYPLGINNLGTVIGVQRERFGDPFLEVGFTWMKGVGFTPIPALPGDATAVPMGINNSGLVVGVSFPASMAILISHSSGRKAGERRYCRSLCLEDFLATSRRTSMITMRLLLTGRKRRTPRMMVS